MARRSRIARKKSRSGVNLSRKRRADKVPLQESRAVGSDKRARSHYADEEEIGDFIVVDTGTTEAIDRIQDDDNESLQGNVDDASDEDSLQTNEGVVHVTDKASDIDVDVVRRAQDALLVIIPEPTTSLEGNQERGWSTGPSEDFMESSSILEPNRRDSNSPSSDKEYQTTWPPLCSDGEPSVTGSASHLAEEDDTGLSLLPKDTPDDNIFSAQSIESLPSSQEPEPSNSDLPNSTLFQNHLNSTSSPQTEIPAATRIPTTPLDIAVADGGQRSKLGMFGIVKSVPSNQSTSDDTVPEHGVASNDELQTEPKSSTLEPFRWSMLDYNRADTRQVPPQSLKASVQITDAGDRSTGSPKSLPLPSAQQPPSKVNLSEASRYPPQPSQPPTWAQHLPEETEALSPSRPSTVNVVDSSAHASPRQHQPPNLSETEISTPQQIRAGFPLRPQQHSQISYSDSTELQPTFSHPFATLHSADNPAPHNSPTPRWTAVNTSASILPEVDISTSISNDVSGKVSSQPLASIAPKIRNKLPTGRSPRPLRPNKNGLPTTRTHILPIQMDSASSVALSPSLPKLTRRLTPRSDDEHTQATDILSIFDTQINLDTGRTVNDKKRLRNWAADLIAGRDDIQLEEDETTGGPKRAYPDIHGAIVDKNSANGIVVVTSRGFPIQQVDTAPGTVVGFPYAELILQEGQACVTYGDSTVLYYKPRKATPSPIQALEEPRARVSNIHQMINHLPPTPILPTPSPAPPEITIRLQIDDTGRFSLPYNMSIFLPKDSTQQFFHWFAAQTSRGGIYGPPMLTFTFQNTLPTPKVVSIPVSNEDDFRYLRKSIIPLFEKTRGFMPELKEFVVLISDPEWRKGR